MRSKQNLIKIFKNFYPKNLNHIFLRNRIQRIAFIFFCFIFSKSYAQNTTFKDMISSLQTEINQAVFYRQEIIHKNKNTEFQTLEGENLQQIGEVILRPKDIFEIDHPIIIKFDMNNMEDHPETWDEVLWGITRYLGIFPEDINDLLEEALKSDEFSYYETESLEGNKQSLFSVVVEALEQPPAKGIKNTEYIYITFELNDEQNTFESNFYKKQNWSIPFTYKNRINVCNISLLLEELRKDLKGDFDINLVPKIVEVIENHLFELHQKIHEKPLLIKAPDFNLEILEEMDGGYAVETSQTLVIPFEKYFPHEIEI
jgi:hypothetical protein